MKTATLINASLAEWDFAAGASCNESSATPEQSDDNHGDHGSQSTPALAERILTDAMPDEVASEMGKLTAKLEMAGHPLAMLPAILAPLLGAKGSKGWKHQ